MRNISFNMTTDQVIQHQKVRKWRLPLTYQPMIKPVLRGKCRQTIRPGNKKKIGDLIRFYVWSGRPYRSKQTDLTEYQPLIDVINILILDGGIVFNYDQKYTTFLVHPWNSKKCNDLAARDFIVPPTGEALREVLISIDGKIPAEGIQAQILRW